jgi:hypothetical protein
VLCCRSSHNLDIFHRVEKWNGRFYQKGALWQVGVKLYVGHHGKPCPNSAAALSGVDEYIRGHRNGAGDVLGQVAGQFGLLEQEVLQTISDCLEHENGTTTQMQRDILIAAADKSGVGVLDLLKHLKQAVADRADADAADLQAESNKAVAEAEAEVGAEGESQTEGAGSDVIIEEDICGNEEDWEDEDTRPIKGDMPRFLPRPPPVDGAGNKFVTVVHTNGFHSLPAVWCSCAGRQEHRDLLLLDQHLYPSSYDRIKTVFTFDLLNDHRQNYLECKSSHYQYHNQLRRKTCPQCPEAAPNRYKELCRVARQWRNLKYRKWFWLLNNQKGLRGEMGLFCAACPQDGVNLPPGWKEEQKNNPYGIPHIS